MGDAELFHYRARCVLFYSVFSITEDRMFPPIQELSCTIRVWSVLDGEVTVAFTVEITRLVTGAVFPDS